MKKNLSILIIILLWIFVANLWLGSVDIPILEVIKALVGNDTIQPSWKRIIVDFRLPRAFTAILAGMALSLSGLFMQTFFRNPLAGPFVLGISSGASLGVAFVVLGATIIAPSTATLAVGNWGIISGAVSGAFLVFSVIMFFSRYVRNNTSLLIIGLMFSSATSSVVSILQYFSSAENIQAFVIWTFGDLGSVTRQELVILFPIVTLGLVSSVLMIKPMNILQIGETYAANAGLNVGRTRYFIILITAILAGSITAFCGPIAFVGLAVPHIARMISKTSDHNHIMPTTALIGAIVLLSCDIISRLPGSTNTLPLNAVTALFGAPLVIWLITKRKSLQGNF